MDAICSLRKLNFCWLGKVLTLKKNHRCLLNQPSADPRAFVVATFSPTLTVAVVEEVCDGGRGAAAPRFGGVDGGEDGGHEPLVAVHPETLLAELGVVVGQAEEVTCGAETKEMMDEREAMRLAAGLHKQQD